MDPERMGRIMLDVEKRLAFQGDVAAPRAVKKAAATFERGRRAVAELDCFLLAVRRRDFLQHPGRLTSDRIPPNAHAHHSNYESGSNAPNDGARSAPEWTNIGEVVGRLEPRPRGIHVELRLVVLSGLQPVSDLVVVRRHRAPRIVSSMRQAARPKPDYRVLTSRARSAARPRERCFSTPLMEIPSTSAISA